MPRTTQYVRKDDLPGWKAISNRAAWIHEHLSHTAKVSVPKETATPEIEEILIEEPIVIPEGGYFCPNGHSIPIGSGHCLFKSCKYAN